MPRDTSGDRQVLPEVFEMATSGNASKRHLRERRQYGRQGPAARELRELEKCPKGLPEPVATGGEVGLWSSKLDSLPAPQAKEAMAEIEELGYAAL